MRITRKRLIGTGVIAAGSLVSAGIGVSVAASSAPTRTLSFKSVLLTSHSVSETRGISINTGKDVQHGKFIGNTVSVGRYHANTRTVAVSVAFALEGGLIYAHAVVTNHGVIRDGKVTGGTGDYKGISGTLTGTPRNKKSSNMTITYH
jgi:hypothetical protein